VISLADIIKRINTMGFDAQSKRTQCHQHLDLTLSGISDETMLHAVQRIKSIVGIVDAQFPSVNESSHVQIVYDADQIDSYTIYLKLHSIGYQVQANSSNVSRADLRVQGMHCNSCAMNITGTVEDLPGIHHVQVSFDDQSATILFDDHLIPLSMIVKEIEKLDFQVAISSNMNSNDYNKNNEQGLSTTIESFNMILSLLLSR
jgi:copper chaperone CopZ